MPEGVKLPLEKLSKRERQIAGLLGRGRTAREISQELGTSVRTVQTQCNTIKLKLDLRASAAATVAALAREVAAGRL